MKSSAPLLLWIALSCNLGCANKQQQPQLRLQTPASGQVADTSDADKNELNTLLEKMRKRLEATTDTTLRINAFGNGREGHTIRVDLLRNSPEWQKRFRKQVMDSPALRFDGPDRQEPCELDGAAQIGNIRLVPQQDVFPTSSHEAHFILYNQSEDTISYGSDYDLAYERGGQWYYLPTDRVFTSGLISLLPNGQTTFSANLYPEVNENRPGRYRFFKEVTINRRKERMMAEFQLSGKNLITVSSQPGQDNEQAPSPEAIWAEAYDLVEEMPDFPGGPDSLQNYLSTQMHYPTQAAEQGIEGKVIVRFIVREDGSIGPVHVDNSSIKTNPHLEKEAVRLVEGMPRWTPGRHHGQTVSVRCVLPIVFRLPE